MTEKELRQKVITQAVSWLGLKEADNSFRPIIDAYNRIQPLPANYRMSYADPWCAAFVSAAGFLSGLTGVILPECSCDRMIALYKTRGRWVEDDNYYAQPGDLVFYDWDDSGNGDCTGSADHVGLIVDTTQYYFKVIEGNKTDAVGYRTIAKGSRFIRGFAVPNYASKADTGGSTGEQTAAQPISSKPKITLTLTLPELESGANGETVRAAQLLLIGRGYRCGPEGADGEFGPGTKGGVMGYQRGHKLDADGVIGKKTWSSLLGVTE